mgnify:CR=1 FL=1
MKKFAKMCKAFTMFAVTVLFFSITMLNCGGGVDCQSLCEQNAKCAKQEGNKGLIDLCVALCTANKDGKCKETFECQAAAADCSAVEKCKTCTVN